MYNYHSLLGSLSHIHTKNTVCVLITLLAQLLHLSQLRNTDVELSPTGDFLGRATRLVTFDLLFQIICIWHQTKFRSLSRQTLPLQHRVLKYFRDL